MKRLHRPDLALIVFAVLVLAAIFVLSLVHDPVPGQMWTVEFAVLAAAGVAIVPGATSVFTDASTAATPDASPPPADTTAPAAPGGEDAPAS